MDFDAAFERLIGHEGVLSMDPQDRGNWTGGERDKGRLLGSKYGISAASYPGEDIAGLTLERARELYKRDYWGPAGCDAVPDPIKFDLFDMAVNSGKGAAVRALQKAAGAAVDGILGPRTLAAVQAMPPARLLARFNGARLAFMADAPTWPAHGRGWARRIASNLLEA
jgi:Putative secretion activating protein